MNRSAAVTRPWRFSVADGNSFTIIGITQPGFFGTTLGLRSPDVWIPFTMQSVVRYAQNAVLRMMPVWLDHETVQNMIATHIVKPRG